MHIVKEEKDLSTQTHFAISVNEILEDSVFS